MFWIVSIGACVCAHRHIQICGHGSTHYTHKHTQQMKWELLIHVRVTAMMTDDCILSESKSLPLHFYLCQRGEVT